MKVVSIESNPGLLLAALITVVLPSCESAFSGTLPATAADPAPRDMPKPGNINKDANSPVKKFEKDNRYVIFDIDVNRDGIPDKVVSSAQNSGNELLFFENLNGRFVLKLTTINLSEDGGRVLQEIRPVAKNKANDVLIIETYFPQGHDVAKHYVSYRHEHWFLSRTEFEISDWRVDSKKIYVCDVTQGIPMESLVSSEGASAVRQLPEESLRNNKCLIKRL